MTESRQLPRTSQNSHPLVFNVVQYMAVYLVLPKEELNKQNLDISEGQPRQ